MLIVADLAMLLVLENQPQDSLLSVNGQCRSCFGTHATHEYLADNYFYCVTNFSDVIVLRLERHSMDIAAVF